MKSRLSASGRDHMVGHEHGPSLRRHFWNAQRRVERYLKRGLVIWVAKDWPTAAIAIWSELGYPTLAKHVGDEKRHVELVGV